MSEFGNRWKDVPDYILGITQEIWEGRGIETLDRYYAPDIVMRLPEGISVGNEATKSGTLATLAQFPDRELLGEDVIFCGDETGYLSSHRIFTMGTHLGDGYYGPPTGKRFRIRAIADCAGVGDQINDEWLIRDTAGLLRQIGLEERAFARALIEREGGPEACVRPFSPAVDVPGPYRGRGNDNEWGAHLADILARMMRKDFAVVRAEYDRAVEADHPGATTHHGWQEVEAAWMALRASFPDARFTIEHRIGRDDPKLPPRAAVRWGLHGKHSGWGMFGRPTGAEVYVMGFTHAEFGPRGLRHEWTLFDPVSIWKQIFIHEG